MPLIKNLSIRNKVIAINLASCLVVLVFASLVFIGTTTILYRHALLDELESIADMVGHNSRAALVFNDREGAKAILAALASKRNVTIAQISTKDGVVLAQYRAQQTDQALSEGRGSGQFGHSAQLAQASREPVFHDIGFLDGLVDITVPIRLDGEVLGAVLIESNLKAVFSAIKINLAVAFAAILISIALAFVFAARLQKVVSQPILHLLETMRRVSTEEDYAVRAKTYSDDELGTLTGGFNEMLTHIQSRDTALQVANAEANAAKADLAALNAELEARVEERTAELRELQIEAVRSERLAALGQLTATVSHELRNPLGALRTSLFLVGSKTQDKGLGIERALARSERSIERCDNIITEMLDFARTSEVAAESGQIDDWLADVLSEQEIPDGIKVNREFGASGTILDFDADRLRRAVINVFDNGCQAMTESLREGDTSKDYSMTLNTLVVDDRYEMIFTDTGQGMDEETLGKIFEPLFSTKSFGTGLGMPTVKQIMELHNGGIEIESTSGKGTTVILWLPLTPQLEQEKVA